ncbi:MAG: DDE-type integrase/transposase/recombinase [Dehalococcoidia bacterium]|nr:DDE-type integrase/transposase/recombinase [Dehalococcoidia bacterium]
MDFGEAKDMAEQVLEMMQPRKCKYCESQNVVKWSKTKGRQQRLLCRQCGHTFIDNSSIQGMKTPQEQVASAMNMYYEGMSLNAIRRQLQQDHDNCPSDSTVYEWITRFTKKAVEDAKGYKPTVGDVWVADETVLRIEGKNYWYWDIIDFRTRYLLGSHMSLTRRTGDARILVERAAEKAGKAPKVIVTDRLASYIDVIELAFGNQAKHIKAKTLTSEPAKQLIERFHGTLKERNKVVRGMKNLDKAYLMLEGWLVYYNYLRPHEYLKGKTPAEKAGINFPYHNWADIVKPKVVIQVNKGVNGNRAEPMNLHHTAY